MNSFKINILIVLSLVLLASGSAGAAIRVFAKVGKSDDIYVGESFGYYIFIQGSDKAGQVDLRALAQYNPEHTGNKQQTSTQIINNRVSTQKTIVMTYTLSADSTGIKQLPAVTVTIDAEEYKTNPIKVNILEPGTTDRLDLEVTLSENKCYVGQPVIMTVKFYISADIGDFRFNIPAFTSDEFYIEDPDPDISNPEAKEYDLGNGVIVSVSQHRTTHNNRESVLLSFRKVLIPKIAGEIGISPASVSADVAIGTTRNRDRLFNGIFGTQKEYKRFMVSSQPMSLTVLPLPEENKPEGFYGLVGQYTISASAAPVKVSVGDPITLTIKIGGGKYLKPVLWPALEEIPELASNFKIPSEKASPKIKNGHKVFIQTVRANNDEIAEIPAIPLAYFDAEEGVYRVARTKPIKLDVAPTKILTNADLEGSDLVAVNKEVEAIKKGLSANYEGLGALRNQAFSPLAAAVSVSYLFIWAGPLALLIVSCLVKIFTHTTPEKVAARCRRTASNKAVHKLKKLYSCSDEHWFELFALIMKQYIGDRFDKIAGSLTSNDCFEIVFKETKDRQCAEKYREFIAWCEAARYASTEKVRDSSRVKEAIGLIKIIEKKSKK